MTQSSVTAFTKGVHSRFDDELIPRDAATSALNWLTKDGAIELAYGRKAVGAEGTTGKIYGQHVAYKANGTAVLFRKAGTKIQYLSGTTWTDVITGLTASDVTFSNYASLAGSFVYIFSPDDGIHLICVANPASYATLNDTAKNFRGYGLIDRARTIMWGVKKDPTGFYGSYIDAQNSTVYTTVAGEALADVATGTLAFKAGGATRTCFGVTITDTSSGEVFTDDYNGVLTGSLGSTGTINYMTGAFTISGQSGAGTAGYQWWTSNTKGPTDFTKSATRLAGEGFIVRQDAGGDKIQVVVPLDGSYFSLKTNSAYQFTPDVADTAPTNEIFRTNIGVSSLRGAIGTSKGIVFMNTANASEPELHLLSRNPLGDNFISEPIFPEFDFGAYTYSDVMLEAWDRYLLVGCKEDSSENNRLLICDMRNGTVNPNTYGIRAAAQNAGTLYGGDPLSLTTYELFSGFDDMGITLTNHWITGSDSYGDDVLKKVKKLRLRGRIDPNQAIKVYLSRDNGEWQHVGTIVGSGDYVDYTSSFAIGTDMIGVETVGGGDTLPIYNFYCELKLRLPKFRKRQLKFEATGFGYCSIQTITDFDIWTFQDRLPKHYRTKQNVSLDGLTTNEDTPVI